MMSWPDWRAARGIPGRVPRLITNAMPRPESPPMRGADPAIFLVPGVGMFSFGRDKQTARVAGEFYVNAINVMRGAEALSSYEPIPEREKFRIEYWELEEQKLRRMPPPRPLVGSHCAGHRGGVRDRGGHRPPPGEGGSLRGRAPTSTSNGPPPWPKRSVAPMRALSCRIDVSSESDVAEALHQTVLGIRRRRPGRQQRRPVNFQKPARHDRRGLAPPALRDGRGLVPGGSGGGPGDDGPGHGR